MTAPLAEPLRFDVPEWLPDAIVPLVKWLITPWVMLSLAALSAALFVMSLVGVGWVVQRIPPDYLLRDRPRPPARGLVRVGRLLRNLVGVCLFSLGVLMLALPGQGLLTMLVGLTLVDFPGKRRVERRLLGMRGVLDAINRLRHRAGRPELRLEADAEGQDPRPPDG